jgi:gliding motility-associated lipoprotein GldJ
MKMRVPALLLFFLGVISLSSCSLFGGGGSGDISPTTGWAYNDPDNGGFEVAEYNEQTTGPGLVLVEGGRFTMGRTQQDVMFDWNNQPRTVTLSSFYMDETEIRNVDYREYLYWIRRVYKSYPEVYQKAIPDTLVWRRRLAYNDPYVEYYFRHPAYHFYPVVGVSWTQANEYASWRSDRVNEQLLIDQGILEIDPNQADENNFNTDAYLAGQYQGAVKKGLPSLDPNQDERPVRWEDGILLPKYRLPTEAEWEFAALALIGNSFDSPERILSGRLYPWNGHFHRNPEKKQRGLFMANFQRGRGDMMGVAGYLNDKGSIPAQVDAYWPNDYGLYCMAGNVNEWVLDVYRPRSSNDMDGFNPYRGNIFQKKKMNPDGTLAEKDSLGRIQYVNVTDEESADRYNYTRADNRNYLDGDLQSSISNDYMAGDNKEGSDRMYYQGKGEKKVGATTLINDHARVYKGGSWRDRAYWLTPGTRRFLDQDKSRDDIGFRCAMIRVGSPTGNK